MLKTSKMSTVWVVLEDGPNKSKPKVFGNYENAFLYMVERARNGYLLMIAHDEKIRSDSPNTSGWISTSSFKSIYKKELEKFETFIKNPTSKFEIGCGFVELEIMELPIE